MGKTTRVKQLIFVPSSVGVMSYYWCVVVTMGGFNRRQLYLKENAIQSYLSFWQPETSKLTTVNKCSNKYAYLYLCSCYVYTNLLVMPIGNKKFGVPRNYHYQIGIWCFCPKLLGIFLVFCRNLAYGLLKIWLNIGIFRQNKIGLVFGFRSCYFIGVGLVLVCHFRKSGISNIYIPTYTYLPTEKKTLPKSTELGVIAMHICTG